MTTIQPKSEHAKNELKCIFYLYENPIEWRNANENITIAINKLMND